MLLAYLLVSAGRIEARSAAYQWLNLLGAIGLVVNTWYNGAIPSAVLNIVWAGIAVVALVRAKMPFSSRTELD